MTGAEEAALLRHAEQTFASWSRNTWKPGEPRPRRPSSYSIPHRLLVDDPCPLCNGTTNCGLGCPKGKLVPENKRRWVGQREPIRPLDYPELPDGTISNTPEETCPACTIYGTCMNCRDGIGYRHLSTSANHVDLALEPYHDAEGELRTTGPTIRVTYDKLAKMLAERDQQPSLF